MNGPDIQKLLDVHNGTHLPLQFLPRSQRECPYFWYLSWHTPHACNCVKTSSERARRKLCPLFAFVFHCTTQKTAHCESHCAPFLPP